MDGRRVGEKERLCTFNSQQTNLEVKERKKRKKINKKEETKKENTEEGKNDKRARRLVNNNDSETDRTRCYLLR